MRRRNAPVWTTACLASGLMLGCQLGSGPPAYREDPLVGSRKPLPGRITPGAEPVLLAQAEPTAPLLPPTALANAPATPLHPPVAAGSPSAVAPNGPLPADMASSAPTPIPMLPTARPTTSAEV